MMTVRSAIRFGLLASLICIAVEPSFAQNLIGDAGFETPPLGGNTYTYQVGGAPWTFSSTTGISRNAGSSTSFAIVGNPADGTQYAFLQTGMNGNGVSSATVLQSFSLSSASSVTVAFSLAGRSAGFAGGVTYAGATLFSSAIDSTTFDTEQTASNQPFTARTFTINNLSAGTHTLTFTATEIGNSTADNTALVDAVSITTAPEPSALSLLSLAGIGCVWAGKRHRAGFRG